MPSFKKLPHPPNISTWTQLKARSGGDLRTSFSSVTSNTFTACYRNGSASFSSHVTTAINDSAMHGELCRGRGAVQRVRTEQVSRFFCNGNENI
jgi:hypothetical protein